MSRAIRRAIEIVILSLVALTLWRTWYVEGLPVSFTVASGSMAETLLGPHRSIVCGDCGFPFVCGCDRPAVDSRAVCPNCDYAGNDVRDWPEFPGDRVLVHRATYQLRTPRRWEVIALHTPGREREVSVKRVVGLPGETIEIRDGHVYVNGQLARRTLDQQYSTSILVHDAAYPPQLAPGSPPRWRPDAPGGWSWEDGRFTHPQGPELGPTDWLTYHHWRRVAGQPKVQEGPILTETAYNQGWRVPSDSLRPTADVRLSFRLLHASGAGGLWVRAANGSELFEIRLVPAERRVDVFRDGHPLPTPSCEVSLPHPQPVRIDVSLVDQQLLVALDHRTLFTFACTPARPQQPNAQPFALGVQELAAELDQLKVFRGIWYDTPNQRNTVRALGPVSGGDGGQYLALGDNSLISQDSRTWPEDRPLTGEQFVGKPFLAYPTSRWGLLGGQRFRIPDISAIRYIR